jgi:hypothetical protein
MKPKPRGCSRLGLLLVAAALLVPGAATAQALMAPAAIDPGGPGAHAAEIRLPASPLLRLDVTTGTLATSHTGPATVSVLTDVGSVPARTTFSLGDVTPDVTMDFDLPAGVISVDGRKVGTFTPVVPLTDNLKFPVDIAIRRGATTVRVRRDITLLLPTVIIPGYSNERRTSKDGVVVKRFAAYGYAESTPRTLFWWNYASHTVGLEDGAHALAAYVRHTVLPATYAAKINVVGYSIGGLFARWNVAYDVDGWSRLVNRLVLIAVPNEGTVIPYIGEHAPPWFPFVNSSKTPLAREMLPVFPFWRAAAGDPWSIPPDARNDVLAALNARPLPPGVRVYCLYANNGAGRRGGPATTAGLTGFLPGAAVSYGSGDGIVLTASALGLPINGSAGVPGLCGERVDIGRVYHTAVLRQAASQAAAALQDRFENAAEVAGRPPHGPVAP